MQSHTCFNVFVICRYALHRKLMETRTHPFNRMNMHQQYAKWKEQRIRNETFPLECVNNNKLEKYIKPAKQMIDNALLLARIMT